MAQCEECKAWQHGVCMGYADAELVPQHYFCEQCRPELWIDLIECVPLPSAVYVLSSHVHPS